MPLVVPGMMGGQGGGEDKTNSWMSKLAGKTLGDNHSETSFAKKDLPKESRVIESGGFGTMDHKPDRLNVHLGDDGTVSKVTHG